MKRTLITTSIALLFAIGSQASFAAEPVWDGNKVQMISEKLDAGVFAFYAKDAKELNDKGGAAATSGGLIVGTKGALLIETMLNKRLNKQVQDLSQKLGGKPLLYAINTSAHGDHSFGNMFLPTSTKIVQHANTRSYIDHHLNDDKAFMIQNFGSGRGIEEIKARTGDVLIADGAKITLDLGGKTVEVIDFGFGQTGGDLWVWEPQSKVLWAATLSSLVSPLCPGFWQAIWWRLWIPCKGSTTFFQ